MKRMVSYREKGGLFTTVPKSSAIHAVGYIFPPPCRYGASFFPSRLFQTYMAWAEGLREWWEIESIKGGVMKGTALRLREDGRTYTATFQMSKVN